MKAAVGAVLRTVFKRIPAFGRIAVAVLNPALTFACNPNKCHLMKESIFTNAKTYNTYSK